MLFLITTTIEIHAGMSMVKKTQKSALGTLSRRGFTTHTILPSSRLLPLGSSYGHSRDVFGTPTRPFWLLKLHDNKPQLHYVNTYVADDLIDCMGQPATAFAWTVGSAVIYEALDAAHMTIQALPTAYFLCRAIRSASSYAFYKRFIPLRYCETLSVNEKMFIKSSMQSMPCIVPPPEIINPHQQRGDVNELAHYLTHCTKHLVAHDVVHRQNVGKESNIIVDRHFSDHALAQHMKHLYQSSRGDKADANRVAEWDKVIAAINSHPNTAVCYEAPDNLEKQLATYLK